MMNKIMKAQSVIAEAEGSRRDNGIGQCSSGTEADKLWPFKLKLSTDNIRWDSLKIAPSQEFEEQILVNLDEASRKLLDAYNPIELHITDVDTRETYKVKLAKKESFWFKPLPDVGHEKQNSQCRSLKLQKHTPNETEKSREEFAYSVEPFRHIVIKQNLSYNQEIGFCLSGDESVVKFDCSVLYALAGLEQLRNLRG